MNIGMIAHDSKKKLMQNFCIAYRGILSKHSLYATGTTGRLIEEVTNLSVHKFLAGHLGGEQQLGSQIELCSLIVAILEADPHFEIAGRCQRLRDRRWIGPPCSKVLPWISTGKVNAVRVLVLSGNANRRRFI